jgi:fructose-bisphosphate aldolase class II
MSFCSMDTLLRRARKEDYAVGAFNIFALEFLPTILQAAEEEHSPIILAIAPIHFNLMDMPEYIIYVKSLIQKATVPAALHLDHGKSLDTIVQGIQLGFPSLMFDGSRLPFAENIDATKKVVWMCKKINVTVEAELGTLNDEGLDLSQETRDRLFTDPDAAQEFVAATGIDALAVSIGNAHGVYKGEPQLDFDRLKSIRDKVPVPLVLHGGSGISDADFNKAIRLGINKINIFTEMNLSASAKVRAILNAQESPADYPSMLAQAREAVKKIVQEKVHVFGSAGKA